MKRRQILTAGGVLMVGSVTGCLGQTDVDGSYRTLTVDDNQVPLVPTDEAYEWFETDDARFVDARSESEYEHVHIAGAVFSEAPDGLAHGDPIEEWPTDTRIVTYCVCPHALAGLRAASLMSDGYHDVYALDDGLEEWIERGYPIDGTSVDTNLPAYNVHGVSSSSYVGEEVWIREPVSGQREVTHVKEDGSYELTIHFVNITDDTPLELETPDYTLIAPLSELTDRFITDPAIAR